MIPQFIKKIYLKIFFGVLIFLILSTYTAFAQTIPINLFPKADGFITDQANVIDSQTEENLENLLLNLQTQKKIEIAIVTIKDLNDYPIDDFTLQLGRHWGVGSKKTDSGIVFLIAPNDNQVRIEVGYGMEPSLTDIQSFRIIENIIPYFKENQFNTGIEQGTIQIVETINNGQVPVNVSSSNSENNNGTIFIVIYFLIFSLSWIGGILGRSKSIWAGGIIGAITGLIAGLLYKYLFLFIGIGFLLGLFFDYFVSKNYSTNKKSWWAGGNRDWWDSNGKGGFGGGSSRGGGGGFSGGSFGGGGASGRW